MPNFFVKRKLLTDDILCALERKYINRLVGKTSPGNVASQKILMKCGARKGEVLKDVFARFGDSGKTSDLICWYLDRPGFEQGERAREVEMEGRREFLARRENLEGVS